MKEILVFVGFFILAGITTFSAIKLSNASEDFQKYSKLSPIIIGAILAVATSLPEFATSLTSSIVLDDPTTSVANPIGSNMFNLVILASLNIIFFKKCVNYNIKNSNNILNTMVIFMYILSFITILNPDLPFSHIGSISTYSILIFLLYFIGIKITNNNSNGEDVKHEDNPQALKKAIMTFIFFSCIVLISSYFLSLLAEEIINITKIEAGFVGAVFLGIATSLPELISSFILCKNGSYDIAAANVLGSNIFNFSIVAINDLFYQKPIWTTANTSINPLLVYGFSLSIITFLAIQFKSKKPIINALLPVLVLGIYIFYLVTSA